MTWRRLLGLGVIGAAAILLLLWVARARLAAELTRQYFQSHGIASSVEIETLGLTGASGRFALGPAAAPEISADRIELIFDPLRWMPYVVEVRLVHPVVHARLDQAGRLRLPSLQHWIDSLRAQKGQSRFVSDDLAVSLTGLHVLLSTPYGGLDLSGDVRLRRNLPVFAAIAAKPANIAGGNWALDLKAANIRFEGESGRVQAHVAGDLRGPGVFLEDLRAEFSANELRWSFFGSDIMATAPLLELSADANSANAGLAVAKPSLRLSARNVAVSRTQAGLAGRADIEAKAGGGFAAEKIRSLLAADPALANAAATNLSRIETSLKGHFESAGEAFDMSLAEPATFKAAAGGVLRIADARIHLSPGEARGSGNASLSGGGLPRVSLAMSDFDWSGDGARGQAQLAAHFDYAMLKDAAVEASGDLSGRNGAWAFTLRSCAGVKLGAFRPGATNLATKIGAQFCPQTGEPLLAFDKDGWRFRAQARSIAADLPLTQTRVEEAAGTLDFKSDSGRPPEGSVTLAGARLTDRAPNLRFRPVTGGGTIGLNRGLWQGKLAVAGAKQVPLGEVTFTHRLADGGGTAHIAAPHLVFAAGKLQPDDLSPLLAAFKRAEGAANFAGDVRWTRNRIESDGRLAIDSLDFLTPLGTAHAVKTVLDFTSLLPPATRPGQSLAISRIDWTLPFSGVEVRFGFSPAAIQVDRVSGAVAEGHASLGAFAINLANPGRIDGTAELSSIALASLITASNLSGKVRLDGKVSGQVPFSAGPDGFRILKGHLEADGVGHLSIDRSLWTQGEAQASSNAVQDFAYQALEALSYDRLSADLNSVAGGRLQIVFHIKGHSDPPKPQEAKVGLVELLNGTALQKPIPLPSGTPIDLTLDTSLNFDELLKSYAEAWSRTLTPGQAN